MSFRSKKSSKFLFHISYFLVRSSLLKRAIVLITSAEEHLNGYVSGLDIVIALGVFALDPDTDGDLLRRHGVEVEQTGGAVKGSGNVKGGLTGYGCPLVRLPDSGGAGVLKGYAQAADDVSLSPGIGGGAGGSSGLAFHLNRLAGEVDVHLLGREEPALELDEGGAVRVAGRTGLGREIDTVAGGDGIENLLIDARRADRGKVLVDHIVGERLLPQGGVSASILDINVQLGRRGYLEVDIIHRCEVRQCEPRKRRGDEHKHRDDRKKEGSAPLDARLRPL